MEEKPLPPGQSVQPTHVPTSTQMAATNAPVSSYSAAPQTYPIESLEVHQEGQVTAAPTYGPTMRSVPFSRRRATIVSLIITIVVILLTGLASAFFINRSSERPTSQVEVPTQDASLEDTIASDLPPELQGLENSLLVNGDVVTRGRLRVVSGSFTNNIDSAALTSNQTITLPNASGEVCLNVNNCNFATVGQLTQIQPAGGVTTLNDLAGGVTIQGSLNQITVATADGVITLSTPQALDANANVQFGSLTLGGLSPTTGVLIGSSGGAVTSVTPAGTGLCLISTAGAPAFQACPGGGSAVSSVNGLTGALTVQGTANQINVASGGTTITLSTPQDIATNSNVTFNDLQLTGTADVGGVAAIGSGSDISAAVPDPDGKTALRVSHTVTTDCAFGCVGIASHIEFDTAGNPFFMTAFSGSIAVEDGRGLANSSGLAISNPLLGTGSTIQQNIGVDIAPQTSGNSNIGVVVGEAAGTKQINLLLGISPDFTWSNVPAGSYSIYNASTDQNYFAGNLGIGDTTPAYALTVGNGDLFGVNSSGNVIVTALGAASTDTVVCRNGSNQLATCNSSFATGSGTAFLQGGNNFGGTTAGTLGTINGGDLNVITTNLTRLTVQADGDVAFDTNTLFVDATNNRVGIGTITPGTGEVAVSLEVSSGGIGIIDSSPLVFSTGNTKYWSLAPQSANNQFALSYQGGVIDVFGNDGRLGIGTTGEPGARLEIQGNWSSNAWGFNGPQIQADAATYNDENSIGTVANAVINSFAQPTLTASNVVTTTNAATVYIQNAPAAGANQTITNAYALWVDDGSSRFDGGTVTNLTVTGTNSANLISGNLTNQTSSGNQYGLFLTNADDAANAITEAMIQLLNNEGAANAVTDYIKIDTVGTDSTADAIDVADDGLFNAINVGQNFILGDGIRQYSSSSGVWSWNDTTGTPGNVLMTLTDAGSTGNLAVTGDLNIDTNVLSVSAANNSIGVNAAAGTSGVITIATSASPDPEIYGTGTNDLDLTSDSNLSLGLDENNDDTNPRFDIVSNAGNDTVFSVIEESGRGITFIQGWLRLGASVENIANGNTLTPGGSYVELTCTTATNCTITLDDATSSEGQTLFLISMDATNTITLNDVDGQQELSATPYVMGQYDTIVLIYTGDRWVEYSRSDNEP